MPLPSDYYYLFKKEAPMKYLQFKRKLATVFFALNIALASVLGALAPSRVHAEPAAPNADPDSEIVYIEGGDEFIRVLDTRTSGSNPEVKWKSPDGDWREFALGDVNNDTDMEIIAIKGGTGSGKLVIFDPVVASGATDPDKKINGIPWAILFEISLPFKPLLVAAGNFDANVAGDEFLVGVEVPEGSRPEADKKFKVDIYKNTNATKPDGKAWTLHVKDRYFEETWTRAAVGDVISGKTEEITFVDEDSGKLEAYRVDEGFARFHKSGDTTKRFQDVAIAQWRSSDGMEIAGVRDVDPGLASLFVWKWSDSKIEDDTSEAFNPPPRRLAFINVNGNSDSEIFLLRNVKDGTGLPHLISRNRGDDGAVTFELKLDKDNGYRAVTGGDVDGDGKEEVIIARDNNIRVYDDADKVTNRFQDYGGISFNRRSIVTGNLDAIGFIAGPVFGTDKSLIEETVSTGAKKQGVFQLSNISTPDSVPFSLSAQNNPSWLILSPMSGQTATNNQPFPISYTMDATNLAQGVYRSRIFIDSTANVINKPYSVVVTFNVVDAQLTLDPTAVLFKYTGACTTTATLPAMTLDVKVGGTPGINFTAGILDSPSVNAAIAALGGEVTGAHLNDTGNLVFRNDNGGSIEVPLASPIPAAVSVASVAANWPSGVPWLTASSITNTVPSAIKLTATPSQTVGTYAEAVLVVVGDARAGEAPDNVRLAPITYVCASSEVLLPLILR